MAGPPSMLAPSQSLLNAEDKALEVTSPWSITLKPLAMHRIILSRLKMLEKAITSLGPDKGLANAKCHEAVDAWKRTNG